MFIVTVFAARSSSDLAIPADFNRCIRCEHKTDSTKLCQVKNRLSTRKRFALAGRASRRNRQFLLNLVVGKSTTILSPLIGKKTAVVQTPQARGCQPRTLRLHPFHFAHWNGAIKTFGCDFGYV
jgi:hypothetical protein